ncbi:MAG: asparagine synthase (glutamine-hydrolyzing) [Deltaproteobacteria bacterium]|nr:asparagine synthase (glutamine-hydrolyzing) [Deltaproteobacteria bacterium]
MCGIAGLALNPNESVEESQLHAMAAAMARRGPDASGFFRRANFGLAHRRLKIIDLSPAAAHPMFNETGDVCVVFNGEIYNFQALRKELESAGHRFRSKSDTEVIVHAYEQWGTRAFARFNGMFAFALWDGRHGKQAIYLARDRFGIKPLFYTIAGGRLAFASELKPLMEIPWIERKICSETLYHFLKFSHVPHPRSMIEGVLQLEPGHWLRFEDGVATGECFREMMPQAGLAAKEQNLSEAMALERLELALRESVERQLVSDVPLGCFLSGGIDSSLLVATCKDLGVNGLKTFTIGYDQAEFDESAHASRISYAFGTEHFCFKARPSDYFSLISEIPVFFDQPLGDPTVLSSLLLSRLAREHVTVALSGDGGDELFFGYPYQHVLSRMQTLARVPASMRGPVFGLIGALASQGAGTRLQKLQKATDVLQFRNEAELFQYFIGTFGPLRMDRLADLLVDDVSAFTTPFSALLARLRELPWNRKIEQVFLHTFLVDTVLAKTDRAGMAYGLEARVPFLDDAIVEVAANTAFDFKFHNGSGKYLMRRLLDNKLRHAGAGSDLAFRAKQGFSIPLRDWFRGELKYLLDEYLGAERLRREGIFRPHAVAALVSAHLSNHANHSHLMWSLVSFQMWRERYL